MPPPPDWECRVLALQWYWAVEDPLPALVADHGVNNPMTDERNSIPQKDGTFLIVSIDYYCAGVAPM